MPRRSFHVVDEAVLLLGNRAVQCLEHCVHVFVEEGGAAFVPSEVQRVYHCLVVLDHRGASEHLGLEVVAAIIVHLGQSVGIFELPCVTLASEDGHIVNI